MSINRRHVLTSLAAAVPATAISSNAATAVASNADAANLDAELFRLEAEFNKATDSKSHEINLPYDRDRRRCAVTAHKAEGHGSASSGLFHTSSRPFACIEGVWVASGRPGK